MENRIKETASGPSITIVVGTLNRPQVVLRLIEQLIGASKKTPLEVLVIDQSLAKDYFLLQRQFPQMDQFVLIHFDKPNTCKYLNYGWMHAKAPIVLYLDDDVTITENTIPAHINAYDNGTIHVVAGRVINDGEKITLDNRVGKVQWYGAGFTKNFSYEKNTYVDFPYGCNMSFRKQTLKEMKGFDEKLIPPIYAFNEVDLGYRISKRRKNSILFASGALVYHHQYKGGGTRNDFDRKEIVRSNNFNYGYFLGKNFSRWENIICLLRRLPYQIMREPSAIFSIIRGLHAGEKNRPLSY
ncbi:MAG: glycosyltransferase [bacterium]